MILQFSVRNFLSIKESITLSMLGTSLKEKDIDPDDVMTEARDSSKRLLKGAVIYGANASGKSNVVKAMAKYRDLIVESFGKGQAGVEIDIDHFRLDAGCAQDTTEMECVFLHDGYQYRYGFEIDRQAVRKEWLMQRTDKKLAKEVELFYREDDTVVVHARCTIIRDVVNRQMLRKNALLLSTAAQFNDPTAVSILEWATGTRVLFSAEDEKLWDEAVKRMDDDRIREKISAFARYADLGIERLEKVDNRIVSRHTRNGQDGEVVFAFDKNESEGTIRFVTLAYPILDALEKGKILVVDELDSKLHPLLLRRIVLLFLSKKTNPKGAQLIMTAHDTNLLTGGLFRRDQVWFTEKNEERATTLFSLAEYNVRGTSPIERDYLSGRYGATPALDGLEMLIGEKEA